MSCQTEKGSVGRDEDHQHLGTVDCGPVSATAAAAANDHHQQHHRQHQQQHRKDTPHHRPPVSISFVQKGNPQDGGIHRHADWLGNGPTSQKTESLEDIVGPIERRKRKRIISRLRRKINMSGELDPSFHDSASLIARESGHDSFSGAPGPNANSERSAVVLALFGPSVGPCIGDFSTTYNRVNGRLYASTKAILFYSNLFGFERRLSLQLSDVDSIERYRSTSVRIFTVDCEDYVFKKLRNRDSVVNLLKELHRQQTGIVSTGSATSEPTEGVEPSDDEVDEEMSDVAGPLRPHLSSDMTPEAHMLSPTLGRRRSQSVPSLKQLLGPEIEVGSVMQSPPVPSGPGFRRSNSSANPATPNATPRRTKSSLGSIGLMKKNQTNSLVPPLAHENNTANGRLDNNTERSNGTPERTDKSPEEAAEMEALWKDAKQPYEEAGLEDTSIPCSLDHFMDMFIVNKAPFPIFRYQQEIIGDKDMEVTKWKKEVSSKPAVFKRALNFIHPLKNPVGPSQAKTSRQQRFQRYGNLGMILENTTLVEGIPAADCFRVEDRWVLEAESENSLRFSSSFRIVFTKRTMFKVIIQKNTKQETRNWIQGYSNFVFNGLSGGDPAAPKSVQSPTNSTLVRQKSAAGGAAATTSAISTTQLVTYDVAGKNVGNKTGFMDWDTIFKITCLILIFCMAYQLYSMQQTLQSLEGILAEQQKINAGILQLLNESAKKR